MSATTEVSPFPPMESELVTDRLRLRPWLLADSGAVRTLWLERDPRVPARRRIDDAGRPTESEIGELIEAQLDESAASGLSVLAIERRFAPGFIGYCGLSIGDSTLNEPEIVFELARSVRGRGYATEAASAVLDTAWTTGRSRVWASVREWNAASFRVLSKLGFTEAARRDPDPDHGDTVWLTLDVSGQERGSRRS